MYKRIAVFLTTAILVILSTGCGYKIREDPHQQETASARAVSQVPAAGESALGESSWEKSASEENNGNPFESQQELDSLPGSLGHSAASVSLDDSGNRLPFTYTGGDFQLDYTVKASGKAKNVGFLLFLDGMPQPYKLDPEAVDYEYMHTFQLEEDDKVMPFRIYLRPVTGTKGDTLTFTVVSIYNPQFQPDMKETSSFGMYHSTLEMNYQLFMEAEPEKSKSNKETEKNCLQNVMVKMNPMEKDILSSPGGTILSSISQESLSTSVLSRMLFDSAQVMDNLKIEKDQLLPVTFAIWGVPGVTYKTTFYVNHKPVSGAEGNTFSTTLEKGSITTIEAYLDTSLLEELNTFYAVSVPINANDYPNAVILVMKSASILIYK